jgi:hypothetical protein
MRMHSFIVLLIGASVTFGCTSPERSYPSHSMDTVWTAMKSVAEKPTYDDWVMLENNVWIDEPNRRIEVYRSCIRDYHAAGSKHWREERKWKFGIFLEEEDGMPNVEFVSRAFGVPAHARIEADRYFNEVGSVLSGQPMDAPGSVMPVRPAEAEAEPSAVPAATTPAPANTVDVDFDDDAPR